MTRLLLIALACTGLLSGCSSNSDEVASKATKYEAADSEPAAPAPATDLSSNRLTSTDTMSPARDPSVNPALAPAVDGILGDSEPAPGGLAPLADDASLEMTLAYFDKTNNALRRLMSGQSAFTTQEAQIVEAKRISREKLAAAEHALALKDIQPETLVVARRTKLEALSQLAGLQDVAAAGQLEAYANELADSENPELVNDSRVVRLGFELDKLRTGRTESTEQLLAIADEFQSIDKELGMPTYFALQQCFSVLSQYGYDDAARTIRDAIAAKFAEHSDPQIAASAKMMASASRFDNLDKLHSSMFEGTEVTADQWQTAIDDLLSQPIDASTFQYLAGLALSVEGAGNEDIQKIVYDAIQQTFIDSDAAHPEIATEARAFVEAGIQRSAEIGKPLSVSYPDLAGAQIDWDSFRGSIVVMPFWAASRPESLQIIPEILELQKEFEGQVRVLGINLDTSDEDLNEFRTRFRGDFPSVRNPEVAGRGVGDPLAKRLGLASFPFAAVIDAEGRIAKIVMGTQRDLRATITELLNAQP